MMDEENKLPLKRVELSLTKFNEVAIPHHLDLLRQHKANIIKYEERGELARARNEQTHARRVTAQLRALIAEMDALRGLVQTADRTRFDLLTQRSRDTTLRAILDYLGLIERSCRALQMAAPRSQGTSPLSINRVGAGADVAASVTSTESVGVVRDAGGEGARWGEDGAVEEAPAPLLDLEHVQLHVDERDLEIREREALLAGWSELQDEVRALHAVWQRAHAQALAQREHVDTSAAHIDTAALNVQHARATLASAERLRAGAYSVGGACVGALIGGPIGLAAGAKAGAVAAAAGSLLGYFGARVLGRHHHETRETHETPKDQDKDKQQ